MTPEELQIGLEVENNRAFAGVPFGTHGEIVARSNSWPISSSVAVKWSRTEDDELVDWFSFSDLVYLNVIR